MLVAAAARRASRSLVESTGMCARFVADLYIDKGLSPDAVKSICLTMSQVFATAEVDRIIARTPCIGVKLPRARVRAEMAFLDTHQIDAPGRRHRAALPRPRTRRRLGRPPRL